MFQIHFGLSVRVLVEQVLRVVRNDIVLPSTKDRHEQAAKHFHGGCDDYDDAKVGCFEDQSANHLPMLHMGTQERVRSMFSLFIAALAFVASSCRGFKPASFGRQQFCVCHG